MGRFIVADTHLGHEGVLHIPGRREFFSGMGIEQHDEYMVETINGRVTKRDKLWHLGDVGFDRPSGYLTKNLLPRINGLKILVAGNHDNSAIRNWKGWHSVMGVDTMRINGYSIILTHIPIHPQEMFWDLNIHGHLHANTVKAFADGPSGGKFGVQRDIRYVCVSVEHLPGFGPVEIETVVEDWVARGGKKVVIPDTVGRQRR